MPIEILFPRKPGLGAYAGAINVDTRTPGKAVPAFDRVVIDSTDRLHHPIDYIETTAPSNGHPRGYYGIARTMLRLDNGAETVDNTFNSVCQSMVICDSSGADGITAGTRILLCGFGSTSDPKNATRNLTTDTTPWTVNTAAGDAQFWGVVRASNGDLYAVTDAGVAALTEWRVSRCPFGSDPTLAASWGNGFECGGPEYAITGMVPFGESVIIGKPDGLYAYSDLTKRIETLLDLSASPDPYNGLRMQAVTNGALYPTADGGLFFTDGVSVQEITPYKKTPRPRDVYTGRITSIQDTGGHIYTAQDCWYNTTQRYGLKVISYIAGAAVDETAAVTNGNLTNGMTLTSYGAAANDRIYIGADVPIEAIIFRVTTNENTAAAKFAGRYSNGTTGTALPFTTSFTAFTAIRDGTKLDGATASLKITGFPASASVAAISATDINTYDLMDSTELQFGGSIGTLTKYWWALTIDGTVTAATRVDETEIVAGRPGLPLDDASGPFAAANDFTHRADAGGLTNILVYERERTVGGEWHPLYSVDMGGFVTAMGWHGGRIGQASGAQNIGKSLILVGRFARVAIHESPTRNPSLTMQPMLTQFTATEAGPILPLTVGDGTYLDDGNTDFRPLRKRINKFYVDGNHWESGANADVIAIFCQIDENMQRHHVGSISGAPGEVVASESFTGRKFRFWAALSDTLQTQEKAPELTYVHVDYDYINEAGDVIPYPSQATVPTT